MDYKDHYKDDRKINHTMAVSLFGGLIRTVAYQPSCLKGFMGRAESLTGGRCFAEDDYEALAEMFVQILKREELSGKAVTVGEFLTRVGDLLDAESCERAMNDPKSTRTLDNIPVSMN